MELLNEIQGFFPRFNDNELDIRSKFIFLMSREHTKTTTILLNHDYKWQKKLALSHCILIKIHIAKRKHTEKLKLRAKVK